MRIKQIVLLWQLLVLAAIMILLGVLLISQDVLNLTAGNILVMVGSVFTISLITGLLFLAGQNREDKEKFFFTLLSIGTKFLLYLLFVLLWWSLSKNISNTFIIAFFVLYLVFTIFLTSVFTKAMKIK